VKKHSFIYICITLIEKTKLTIMLEMSKKVLERVSFDRYLFQKELKKSISWLKEDDSKKLRIWCLASFAMYNDVILEVFEQL